MTRRVPVPDVDSGNKSNGLISHGDVRELRGPLLVMGGVDDVGWDEFATVDVPGGQRHGLVLEVDHDLVTLQVLEGTDGLAPRASGCALGAARCTLGSALIGSGACSTVAASLSTVARRLPVWRPCR